MLDEEPALFDDDEPGIFDEIDEEALERATAEGEADDDAGRVIPNEEVVKWLRTWGTPDEGPPPDEWFR